MKTSRQYTILTTHHSPLRSPSPASRTPSSTVAPNSSTTRLLAVSSTLRLLIMRSGKPTASRSTIFLKSRPNPPSPLPLRRTPRASLAGASSRDEKGSSVFTKVWRAFGWIREIKSMHRGQICLSVQCGFWEVEHSFSPYL